jgi:hypothetical protein
MTELHNIRATGDEERDSLAGDTFALSMVSDPLRMRDALEQMVLAGRWTDVEAGFCMALAAAAGGSAGVHV